MDMKTASNFWVSIEDYSHPSDWSALNPAARAREYCRQLESGEILFFSGVPFDLPAPDQEFLISQKQTTSRFHKNISYKPEKDRLRGASAESAEDKQRLHRIMREYSERVTAFMSKFLSPYERKIQLDFASFRPLEEHSRDLPLKKRNDLLHVDAFPTRPTRGARILRVFTNINPAMARVWLTGEPFHQLAPQYAHEAGLSYYAAQSSSSLFKFRRAVGHGFGSLGFAIADRSPYDLFMLHFHDWLKENAGFQSGGSKVRYEFPAGCTWMVYTDGVPHAALSGQYALEHTYIIPRAALVAPEMAPINVLEKIGGIKLS